ncbi:MAG: hypothetical protein IJI97_07705 [Clostridia bacterium]|nr:hypothetical protein [Clostridia bacterium]
MNNPMSWTLSVPMSHPARTLHTILTTVATEFGYVEVSDETLRNLMGAAAGSDRPISNATLYRMRAELMDLGMIQIENVYGSTFAKGMAKVATRRYELALTPPAHIGTTHTDLFEGVSR